MHDPNFSNGADVSMEFIDRTSVPSSDEDDPEPDEPRLEPTSTTEPTELSWNILYKGTVADRWSRIQIWC